MLIDSKEVIAHFFHHHTGDGAICQECHSEIVYDLPDNWRDHPENLWSAWMLCACGAQRAYEWSNGVLNSKE